MAATESTMLPLGTELPHFNLPDYGTLGENGTRTIDDAHLKNAPAVLIMFICNHCPFVKHVAGELAKLGDEYIARGVKIVAINANDVDNYPDDAPEKMTEEARLHGWAFSYLFDESQDVAKRFQAACTPDFFVFGPDLKLTYRGRLDGSTPRNGEPVSGEDLRRALDATLAGESPVEPQHPSIGCNIKWK